MEESGFWKYAKKIQDEEEPIGQGSDKAAYIDPETTDNENPRVIKIRHHLDVLGQRHAMRTLFYLSKIAHFLHPQNMSDMHLAASKPYVTKSDYLQGQHIPTFHEDWDEYGDEEEQFERMSRKDQKLIEAAWKLVETLRDEGISVDDDKMINFKSDEKGNILYVDDILLSHMDGLSKLENAILAKPESPERRRALTWLGRIKAIEAEKQSKETA